MVTIVWGVTFRAAATLALGAFLMMLIGDFIILRILNEAGHPNHWFMEGLYLFVEIDTIILVISVGMMLIANVLNRRVNTV